MQRFALHARILAALLVAGLVLVVCAAPAAARDLPSFRGPITDDANMLSSDQVLQLRTLLESYQRESGHQFAVLIVPSLHGETVEAFSMAVVEAWKLGRKGVDDGLLLLVSRDDHKLRIEVGYGLEGVVTDAVASRIIREDLTPAFRHSEYFAGLRAALEHLMDTAGDRAPPPAVVPIVREHVKDDAKLFLPSTSDYFEQRLADFQKKTGSHFEVVTVDCPEGMGFREHFVQLEPFWKSIPERDERVYVFVDHVGTARSMGSAIVGGLPDQLAAQILDEVLAPALARGDAAGGVEATLQRLVESAGGRWYQAPVSPPTPLRESPFVERLKDDLAILMRVFLYALGIWWLCRVFVRVFNPSRNRAAPGAEPYSSSWSSGSSSSGSSSSGSSSSGSSSSSSSGGGGSFGGGGASGSW